jgi:carbamoyl-phosphate synthase large subunit
MSDIAALMKACEAIEAQLVKFADKTDAELLYYLKRAIEEGMTREKIHEITKIDLWFIENLFELVEFEKELKKAARTGQTPAEPLLRRAKELGFSDQQLAEIFKSTEVEVRALRKKLGVIPTYKLVDTCAAEFEAFTPYYYSTYESEDEVSVSNKKKIMILGGGPNRIGQGIEFDYCCCHASFALKEIGFKTIMVNCNPKTVSTDYDTSDRLYFEPVTLEDVLNIVEKEKPEGVIVQFGGQTPLNLALALKKRAYPSSARAPKPSIARKTGKNSRNCSINWD